MDCLDEHPILKGAYLVMDNASIHKNPSISRIISAWGYRVLYLPPFSPELTPIEQFWYLVKTKLTVCVLNPIHNKGRGSKQCFKNNRDFLHG